MPRAIGLSSRFTVVVPPIYPANVRPGYGVHTGTNYNVLPSNVRSWFVTASAYPAAGSGLSDQQAIPGGANVLACGYKNLTAIGDAAAGGATGADYTMVAAWEAAQGGSPKVGFLRDSGNVIIEGSDISNRPVNLQALIDNVDAVVDNIMNRATTGLNNFTHINALWLDQVHTDVRQITAGVPSSFPMDNANNPTTARYNSYVGVPGSNGTLSDPAGRWGVHLKAWYRLIASKLQQQVRPDGGTGYFLIPNAAAFNGGSPTTNDMSDTTYYWDTFLRYPTVAEGNTYGPGGTAWRPGQPIFDGYSIEGWQRTIGGTNRSNAGPSVPPGIHSWTERQACMRLAQGFQTGGVLTPRPFLGMCVATNAGNPTAGDYAGARYTRYSHYLEWDGGYGVPWIRDYATNASWTTNDVAGYVNHQLGIPTSPKYQISATNSNATSSTSGVWRRNGPLGSVIVNSTPNSVTFTSGDFIGTVAATDAVAF